MTDVVPSSIDYSDVHGDTAAPLEAVRRRLQPQCIDDYCLLEDQPVHRGI